MFSMSLSSPEPRPYVVDFTFRARANLCAMSFDVVAGSPREAEELARKLLAVETREIPVRAKVISLAQHAVPYDGH